MKSLIMEVKVCGSCDMPMGNTRYDLCWTCWRSSQGYKRIKSDDKYDELQQIINQLLDETEQLSNNHAGWSNHYQAQIKSLNSQVHQLKMQMSQLKYELDNKSVDRIWSNDSLCFATQIETKTDKKKQANSQNLYSP